MPAKELDQGLCHVRNSIAPIELERNVQEVAGTCDTKTSCRSSSWIRQEKQQQRMKGVDASGFLHRTWSWFGWSGDDVLAQADPAFDSSPSFSCRTLPFQHSKHFLPRQIALTLLLIALTTCQRIISCSFDHLHVDSVVGTPEVRRKQFDYASLVDT